MNAMVRITDLPPGQLPAMYQRSTSYDMATIEGMRGAYMAAVGSDFQLSDMVGQEIQVQHVYCHWVKDDGEHPAEHGMRPRVVYITPDGIRISSGSESAYRCFCEAMHIIGLQPPFPEPLRFVVLAHKSTKGVGKYLTLEWRLGS